MNACANKNVILLTLFENKMLPPGHFSSSFFFQMSFYIFILRMITNLISFSFFPFLLLAHERAWAPCASAYMKNFV